MIRRRGGGHFQCAALSGKTYATGTEKVTGSLLAMVEVVVVVVAEARGADVVVALVVHMDLSNPAFSMFATNCSSLEAVS